jgi:hypothetical protein
MAYFRRRVRVPRVENGDLDRAGSLVQPHRRRGEPVAEAGRQELHELGYRDDLAEDVRLGPRQLLLEPRLVHDAEADEGARERNPLRHDGVERLAELLGRHGTRQKEAPTQL